jgi:FkbH-like protein
MKYFIFRNFTIEPLFSNFEAKFSGYGDISDFDAGADKFLWFYQLSGCPEILQQINEIDHFFDKLEYLLKHIPKSKDFYLFTLVDVSTLKWQNSNFDLETKIYEFNSRINAISLIHPNVRSIDFSDFTKRFEREYLTNWKYYYTSLAIINPALSDKFHSWFQRKIDALVMKRKKCIILDLDNTLWGGTLGEGAGEGIQLGNSYPGNCYSDFQRYLVEASKNGIILAVCSKNNEKDVIEVFEKNPDMILKLNHLVSYRINWNNKPTNILEISKELNIGLDSIVFIDDSPVERDIVKSLISEVVVPEFPSQPYLIPQFFKHVIDEYFQIYNLTTEDEEKVRQYKENSIRVSFKNDYVSIDDYLKNLEIEIEIRSADRFNISRIAQMTQKTNQFNVTTRRYTETEIGKFIANNDLVLCGSVKDRFGDNGITLLSIVSFDIQRQVSMIDTFLLSCRILGRGIETAFLSYVLNQIYRRGFRKVESYYLPSSRNEQVKDFYDKNGFTLMEKNESCSKYELVLNKEIGIKSYYKIISREDEG